jgi:hypothetical protein
MKNKNYRYPFFAPYGFSSQKDNTFRIRKKSIPDPYSETRGKNAVDSARIWIRNTGFHKEFFVQKATVLDFSRKDFPQSNLLLRTYDSA